MSTSKIAQHFCKLNFSDIVIPKLWNQRYFILFGWYHECIGRQTDTNTFIREATKHSKKKLSKIVSVANLALGEEWLQEVC